MIFKVMLASFGVAMKTGFGITSLKDASFRKKIKDKNFLMQVRMRDENTGVYYTLKQGKIKTHNGISNEKPDMLIEWKDSATAMHTLFNLAAIKKLLKKDMREFVKLFTEAMISGRLVVEIEFAPTFGFIEAVKDMLLSYVGFLPLLKKLPGFGPFFKDLEKAPYVNQLIS